MKLLFLCKLTFLWILESWKKTTKKYKTFVDFWSTFSLWLKKFCPLFSWKNEKLSIISNSIWSYIFFYLRQKIFDFFLYFYKQKNHNFSNTSKMAGIFTFFLSLPKDIAIFTFILGIYTHFSSRKHLLALSCLNLVLWHLAQKPIAHFSCSASSKGFPLASV